MSDTLTFDNLQNLINDYLIGNNEEIKSKIENIISNKKVSKEDYRELFLPYIQNPNRDKNIKSIHNFLKYKKSGKNINENFKNIINEVYPLICLHLDFKIKKNEQDSKLPQIIIPFLQFHIEASENFKTLLKEFRKNKKIKNKIEVKNGTEFYNERRGNYSFGSGFVPHVSFTIQRLIEENILLNIVEINKYYELYDLLYDKLSNEHVIFDGVFTISGIGLLNEKLDKNYKVGELELTFNEVIVDVESFESLESFQIKFEGLEFKKDIPSFGWVIQTLLNCIALSLKCLFVEEKESKKVFSINYKVKSNLGHKEIDRIGYKPNSLILMSEDNNYSKINKDNISQLLLYFSRLWDFYFNESFIKKKEIVHTTLERTVDAIFKRHNYTDKIIDFVIVWESLFNSKEDNLAHKVASCISLILARDVKDYEKRKEIFENIKKIYSYRSNVVHGYEYERKSSNINVENSEIYTIQLWKALLENNDFYDLLHKSNSEKVKQITLGKFFI